MPSTLDPRNFDWGGRFRQGMEDARQRQNQNALIGMQQKRFGWEQQDRQTKEVEKQRQIEAYSQVFREYGLPEELAYTEGADELASMLLKEKNPALSRSNIGLVNPGDYNPESVERWRQSGNYADLERVWAPINPLVKDIAGVPSAMPQVQRQIGSGYPAGGDGVRQTFQPYNPLPSGPSVEQMVAAARTPASELRNAGPQAEPQQVLQPRTAQTPRSGGVTPLSSLGAEADAKAALGAADTAGKKVSERLDALLEDAHRAENELNAIGEAENLLRMGVIAGTAGDIRLGFGRALATAGIGTGDEVSRTDAYLASTAGLVASVIKEFGAGTGLSDADREYAAKMAAGQIQLTPASMKKILDIRRRAAMARVNRYNKQRERIISNPNLKSIGELYDHIDIGGSSSASGMSDEELKRALGL